MKLLISTFFTVLLIGFAGGSYGQSFEETKLKLLAEQGNTSAQTLLGNMYADGEGVPENDAEAVKWFRLAAEQGDARAQYNLGVMYANGEGVPENDVEAYVWFSVAAARGHENARGNRDIVSDLLTPDQRARGQDMATRCFESDFQDCE